MNRRTASRRLLPGGALALLAATTVVIGPEPARAADNADQITITGVDLAEPLEVDADKYPDLCSTLHQEVDWLVGRQPDAPKPKDEQALGAEYTLVIHVDGEAKHRFQLYPLAEGGPRVFRPAEQPDDQKVKEGWFFGRLTMKETLEDAGVPLTGEPLPAGGGTGGQLPAPAEETQPPDDTSALSFLEEWRESILLTGAVVVAIVAGLAGVSFLIRRKV